MTETETARRWNYSYKCNDVRGSLHVGWASTHQPAAISGLYLAKVRAARLPLSVVILDFLAIRDSDEPGRPARLRSKPFHHSPRSRGLLSNLCQRTAGVTFRSSFASRFVRGYLTAERPGRIFSTPDVLESIVFNRGWACSVGGSRRLRR